MLHAAFGAEDHGHGMSDTSQGPGWWLASDGKWYPPELWTGPPAAGSPQTAQPGAVRPNEVAGPTPVGAPQYPTQYPTTGYSQFPSNQPGVRTRTNGLAVASLVCAIAGFLFFIPAILGIIFGFVARSQIRQSGGRQGGDGLAVAGILVGFAWVVLFIIVFVVSAASTNSNGVMLGHVGAVAQYT
jgi:Domain of unknown function (DUF4190)